MSGLSATAQTDVYLFGGQSNMNAEIVNGFRDEMAILDPGAVLVTPRYRNPGIGLDSGWNGNTWLGDPPGAGRNNFYGGTSSSDPNIGTAYTAMLSTWQNAISNIDGAYEIKGILWVQGEQDAKNETSANRYAASLDNLISRIHEDLGLTQASVQFYYSTMESGSFTYRNILKAQQYAADKDSGDALSIVNANVVDASGLAFSDNVHYTTASQTELGERFARAIIPDNTPPAVPGSLVATAGDGLVLLDWADNTEPDFAGYNLYRSTTSGSYGTALATDLTASEFVDDSVTNDTTYYYVLTATDTSGNESAQSSEVSATPSLANNLPPAFSMDPIAGNQATIDQAYTASISDTASDPESNPLTFSKVSGPAWLTVASDGGLSGTPVEADIGTNTFTVQVDATGGSDTAELQITVGTSGWSTVLSEDFEALIPSDGTPPAGWSLITVAGSPTYATTADGQGSAGHGASTGLAGSVSSTDFLSGYTDLPGAYLVGNTDVTLTTPVRVTFDFYMPHEDIYDDIVLILGAIDDGVSTSSAGELLSAKIGENGGAAITTGLGTTSDRIASTATNLTDDTWYQAVATWTPTAGATGTLTLAVSDFTGEVFSIETSSYTFDNSSGQVGFGSVNDTIRFDNISVEQWFGDTTDSTPPSPPTGLAATAGDASVGLNWNDNSEEDLASYSVYRSTTMGSYGSSLASGLTTSDYLDTTAENGTTYYYVVSATDSNGNESAQSSEASATPVDTAPAAPADLGVTPGDGVVSLDWADNSESDLAGYSVYRTTTLGSYGSALASGLTTSDYTDNTVSNDTTYYYVVTATDLSGNESAQSIELDATPTASTSIYENDFSSAITSADTGGNTSPWINNDVSMPGTGGSTFIEGFTSLTRDAEEANLDRSGGSNTWLLINTETWSAGDYTVSFDGLVTSGTMVWDVIGGNASSASLGVRLRMNVSGPYIRATSAGTAERLGQINEAGDTAGAATSDVAAGSFSNTAMASQSLNITLTDAHVGSTNDYILIGWAGASGSIDNLSIAPASVAGSYADWISGYDVGGQTAFTDDSDNDGLGNGIENYFGTHPGEFSYGMVSGSFTGDTFTFTHPISDTPASDIAAAYRWSKDLNSGFNADGATSDGTTVNFSQGTPEDGIVTVTGIITGTSSDKFFVDIKVTQQ